jgi:hypothetical protein
VKHPDVRIGTVTEDKDLLVHIVNMDIGVNFVKTNVLGKIADSAVKIEGFVPRALPGIGDISARGNVR